MKSNKAEKLTHISKTYLWDEIGGEVNRHYDTPGKMSVMSNLNQCGVQCSVLLQYLQYVY